MRPFLVEKLPFVSIGGFSTGGVTGLSTGGVTGLSTGGVTGGLSTGGVTGLSTGGLAPKSDAVKSLNSHILIAPLLSLSIALKISSNEMEPSFGKLEELRAEQFLVPGS